VVKIRYQHSFPKILDTPHHNWGGEKWPNETVYSVNSVTARARAHRAMATACVLTVWALAASFVMS
jgi:hypothetical protein